MKKYFTILGIFFIIQISFSQNTRKFSLETTDSLPDVYAPTGKMPELVVQEGSSGSVDILKYSKDGKYLMAGTFSDVKIYDAESGYLLKSFEGIHCKDFSPDGKYFVWLSYSEDDYKIRITDIETGKEKIIGEISHKNSNYVRANTKFAFSPDGKYLAVPMVDWIDVYYVETFELEEKYILKTPLLQNFKQNDITGWHFYDEITWSYDSRFLSCITGWRDGEPGDWNLIYEIIHGYVENLVGINKIQLRFPSFSPISNVAAVFGKDSIYIFEVGGDVTSDKIHKFDIKDEKICGLSFTPDGKELIVLHEYSYSSFKFTDKWNYGEKRSFGRNEKAYSLAISPDSKEFALGIDRKIELYSNNDKKFVKLLYGNSEIEKIQQNTDNFHFYITTNKIDVSAIFDEDFNKVRDLGNLPKKDVTVHNIATFDGGFFYHERNSSKIMQYKNSSEMVKEICDLGRNVSEIGIVSNFDGKLLAILDAEKEQIKFYRENNNKFSEFNSVSVKDVDIIGSCFNRAGNLFFNGAGSYKTSNLIDVNNGSIFANLHDILWLRFSNDGSYFALYSGEGTTDVWNIKTGEIVKSFEYFNAQPVFSNDSKKLAIYSLDDKTGNLGIDIYDVSSWKKIQRLNAPHRYAELYFNKDATKVFILDVAGIVRCYSVSTGELLASFMLDNEGDYFTYTPEGYFTGSPGGINKFVHLVDGMQVFELGQLYDTLYRPDLVQAKLEGKNIGAPVLKDIVATGDAPRVQFVGTPMVTSRNIKLEFSVQDTGGGVGYVYLSQNGKAMQVSAGEESKTGRKFIYTCDVTLAKGENVFEAYAANSANKIESRHVSVTLSWQGKVENANLYVLAMGVDKYAKMPKNNLKYSVADATAIIESFKTAPGGLYSSVNVMTLLDSDVNKANIQKAFETFSAKVKPDDMFVLHIAGHGVNYGGEYYFLPADTNAKREADFASQGVSKHFLTENLSKIQALNTLVLLDTCYSGAFIDAKAQGNELAQKTALEHLAHTSGQVILTAAANSQTAGEGYEGHGIFTYAIMEALSGKANYNADSSLSIKEITQYIGYEIPNIYEKIGQARQSPWASPLRGDFSVVSAGNKASPLSLELSPDGQAQSASWFSVRVDDSAVATYTEAYNAEKSTQKKSSAENSSQSVISPEVLLYGNLGIVAGDFYDGLNFQYEGYFFKLKYLHLGPSIEFIATGPDDDHKDSMEDDGFIFFDAMATARLAVPIGRFVPYICGGAGGYVCLIVRETKNKDLEDNLLAGFAWQCGVGLNFSLTERLSLGGFYKLKYFDGAGYIDNYGVSFGIGVKK